jgi:ADP-heptose:LPS heptosyltransferase
MKHFLNKIVDMILPLIFLTNRRVRKVENGEMIVIISLHKLGDAVFTIPAIRNIINYHSRQKILLICFKETVEIFKLIFNNIEYGVLERKDFHFGGRIGGLYARSILNKAYADKVYDITGCITSASILFNCNAKEIVGTNELRYKPLYDIYSDIVIGSHMSDIYLNTLKPVMDISYDINNIVLSLPQTSAHILIHPFAGWKAKEWNYEKYLNLAEKLSDYEETKIIIPNGYLLNDDLINLKKRFSVVETMDVKDLIECIKGCFLFICNDSGPGHIANLLGKPVFTIYGPTNPSFHQPKSGLSGYIAKNIVCSPMMNEKLCFTNGGRKGCPSFECMKQLGVDEVFLGVLNFINKIKEGE